MQERNARLGNWLPSDRKLITDWINELIADVKAKENTLCNGTDMQGAAGFQHEEVSEFKDLLDNDPRLHSLAAQMIEQGHDYCKEDPTGEPQINSYDLMLKLIDEIMNRAPKYMPPGAKGRGLIGFPINAILDWCMGTPAGYAFFLDTKVNQCFEKILKAWCRYLSSEDSAKVLNGDSDGWLCEAALQELQMDLFDCDPEKPHYGFGSWNEFFTRTFLPGKRPVEGADDPYVIVSACESVPYRICTNAQKDTKFWLKGQPYSLEYMLNQDESADMFVGGTVYQAFLSATKYHRWHSPVSGTIKRCFLVPGTYYAELSSYPYDDAGPNNSQCYITHVAARAVILIDSKNKDIGLMAFIAVGMAEVSSCVMTVKEGQDVEKGDELGFFQFGGSTHCLIFQKDVIDMFVQDAIPAENDDDSKTVKVCAKLAVAKKRREEL